RTPLGWYRELLRLRRSLPALRAASRDGVAVTAREEDRLVVLQRGAGRDALLAVLHFGDVPADVGALVPAGRWTRILDSAAKRWRGRGSSAPRVLEVDAADSAGGAQLRVAPHSCVLYARG